MFAKLFRQEDEKTPVDRQIETVLEKMRQVGVDSEDYGRLMTHLERLTDLKCKGKKNPISSDTIVMVIGNLVGIVLIIAYEQKHVLTSRALNQLPRPR
jgi:hypothetical protein